MKPFEIIIPCKRFSEGKSRLGKLLDPSGREILCRTLLSRTVRTAVAAAGPDHVTVVSSDSLVLALARQWGVRALTEDGSGLNEALHTANNKLLQLKGVPRMLVALPTDLPLLEPEDLQDVITRTQELGIAPDLRGTGTNLLVLSADLRRTFPFMFGANSYEQHTRLAKFRRVHTEVIHRHNLAFDLDLPEDLQAFVEVGHKMEVSFRRSA